MAPKLSGKELRLTSTPVLTRNRFLLAMLVMVMVEALSSFEHVMMIAAFPMLGREFGLTSAGWTMTAFLLVQGSTAAIGARLGDLYGHARMVPLLLALSMTGSLVSALSDGVGWLIFGRGLQGLSGAILPLAYAITRRIAPARELPFWIGAMTGGVTISSAAGFVLGGYIADLGDWRLLFWFAFGYGLVVLPLFLLVVPRWKGTPATGRTDWLGALLLPAGLAGILYAIGSAFSAGPFAPGTIVPGGAGIALLAWWWRNEWAHPEPLIQVRHLVQRPILIANMSFAVSGLGIMQFPIVMMQYLQQPVATGAGLGLSATTAGLLKLPSNVGSLFTAMLAGWLCGRIGGSRVIQLAGVLSAMAWLSAIYFRDSGYHLMVVAIAAAAGSTALLASVPNILLTHSAPDRAGEATGLSMVVLRLFSAVGAQLIALMMALTAQPFGGHNYPTEGGYIAIFTTVAASGLVIALLGTLLTRAAGPAPRPA